MAPRRCHRQKPTNRSVSANDSSTITIRQDSALCSRLYEASKNVPRYLFRMWHPGSGGNAKLNTTDRVIPRAFFEGGGHKSMYDMRVEMFVDNTTRHLHNSREVVSEFSSWAASPMFVFNYATTQRHTAYIAVIDTQGIQIGDRNAMFYVPDLQNIFGYSKGCGPAYDKYDWEYLVHGVVEGEHYRAVSFWKLCQYGLLDHLPSLKRTVNAWKESERLSLPGTVVHTYFNEPADLLKIAGLFGSESVRVFVMVALFCCKKRNIPDTGLSENFLSYFFDALIGRREVPENWGNSPYLCVDRFDANHYEDIQQIVKVMKSLYHYCWGKWNSKPRHEPMVETKSSVKSLPLEISTAVPRPIAFDQTDYTRPRFGAYGIRGFVYAVPVLATHHDLVSEMSTVNRSVLARQIKGQQIIFTSRAGFREIASGNRFPLDGKVFADLVTFEKIIENSKPLWFAHLWDRGELTINGISYFGHLKTAIGPLPPKSIWEHSGNTGVLYV
ncbi:hypothetical protein KCU78_g6513, partial [Aureobasidium melanogenum]